jgi:hypothetical protein
MPCAPSPATASGCIGLPFDGTLPAESPARSTNVANETRIAGGRGGRGRGGDSSRVNPGNSPSTVLYWTALSLGAPMPRCKTRPHQRSIHGRESMSLPSVTTPSPKCMTLQRNPSATVGKATADPGLPLTSLSEASVVSQGGKPH